MPEWRQNDAKAERYPLTLEHLMKPSPLIRHAAAGLLALSLLNVAHAADPSSAQVVEADAQGTHIRITGTITRVDTKNRIVTIKGPAGRVQDFAISDDVKNFAQIRVGDHVNVHYRVAVAVALVKKGDKIAERDVVESGSIAPAGAKPGMTEARRITVTANVIAVDASLQQVTLKGTRGRTVDVRVDDPDVFHKIRKGDQVVATYVESVAVAVEPATK